jgi:hypothetical protein
MEVHYIYTHGESRMKPSKHYFKKWGGGTKGMEI